MITIEKALLEMKEIVCKFEYVKGREDEAAELLELIDFVGERLGAEIPDPNDLGYQCNDGYERN